MGQKEEKVGTEALMHMMVDFETLGTEADSVVLSVGIILFTMEDGSKEEWYQEFDIRPQIAEGRTVSRDTVNWWQHTNQKECRRLITEGDGHLNDVYIAVEDMVEEFSIQRVWSRGCMDFHILQDITENMFPHWMSRDVRTLDEFGSKQIANNHDALEDCHNQLEFVRSIINGSQ